MDYIVTIILTILIFGLLVFVHELGHFLVALRAGVYVEEFAFGFGPKVVSKRWKNVTYRINLIPLGGYVKMLGDMDGSSFQRYGAHKLSKADLDRVQQILNKGGLKIDSKNYSKMIKFFNNAKLEDSDKKLLEKFISEEYIPNHPANFDNKTFSQRFAVLVAGVTMNFILGSILFYVLFSYTNFTVDMTKIGEPNFYGAETSAPPVIFNVYDERFKEFEASLITKFDGETIVSKDQLENLIQKNYNQLTPIEVQTSSKKIESEIILTGDGLFTNFDEEVRDKIIVVDVAENSAAEAAGIEEGSILIALNDIELQTPDEFRKLLAENMGTTVRLDILTPAGTLVEKLVELPIVEEGEPIFGAVPILNTAFYEGALRISYQKNKLFSGVLHASNLLMYNVSAFGEFFGEAFREKSVEPVFSKVNSIVAVVDITFYFVQADNFISLLNLVAMLSVVLAFMNILPIPLFDGGHVLFLFIEKLRGKKISTETQNRVGQIFFVLLIILTLLIVFKDVIQFEWPRRIGDKVMGILN